MDPRVGMTAELTHVVSDDDSAARWANELPVLATPVLLWLAELACMRAVESAIEPGAMTLGVAHDVAHLAPTPVGDEVRVTATLTAVDGSQLTFAVAAHDSEEQVLRGVHRRARVGRERFVGRVDAKRDGLLAAAGRGQA